jgi:hypothetical protein
MFRQLLPNKNKILRFTTVQHSDSTGADSGELNKATAEMPSVAVNLLQPQPLLLLAAQGTDHCVNSTLCSPCRNEGFEIR